MFSLQRVLDEAVPSVELDTSNRHLTDLTEKYRDLLEKSNDMVAKSEAMEGYQVR